LTVAKLKAELEKRGLSTAGRKAELVARLVENDNGKQNDFGKAPKGQELQNNKGMKRKMQENNQNNDDDSAPPSPPKKPRKTGTIKVDECCDLVGAQVYEDCACTLNQTNIGQNNNKYYIIQLLVCGGCYYTFNRWGRVGEKGQSSLKRFGSLETALADFKKKFREKTVNDWDSRHNFKPRPGKYTLLEMDHGDDDTDIALAEGKGNVDSQPKKIRPCTLPKETQRLIELIFDNDMFKTSMQQLNIDVKKMPLGKLSKTQIQKGYKVLEELEAEIKGSARTNVISSLTSDFYTLIPHDFGRRVPPLIKTLETVQEKKELLGVLGDIEIAQGLLKNKEEQESKTTEVDHPLDAKYKQLQCTLEPLDKNSEEYKILENYCNATKNQWQRFEIIDIFKVDRHSEGARFKQHDDIEHRKLLWHGTNIAVIVAILSNGLRIMPHSGGRVGKGLYFASENGKSSAYVRPAGDIGIMFLNEVALGKEYHITMDNPSLIAPPKGYDSVVAQGRTEPNPKDDIIREFDGHKVIIPQGKPINRPEYGTSSFFQSEYLVYKESQVRIRYLFKIRFN
jgi:poly [ADP-ribose] polymerase